jgi:anti-sigma28 factor (negative regulator of flagellin synthesis)
MRRFGRTMLLAMNKTAQKTPNCLISGHPVAETAHDPGVTSTLTNVSGLNASELRAINDEKLAAIRVAIAKGDYDSDAILEKALDRMLERLEEFENEQ